MFQQCFYTSNIHNRTDVYKRQREAKAENEMRLPEDKRQFVLLPAIAKKRYKLLLDKQTAFEEASDNSSFNQYIDGADKSMGIVCLLYTSRCV